MKMIVRTDATEHKSFGSEVYLICLDAAEELSLRKDIKCEQLSNTLLGRARSVRTGDGLVWTALSRDVCSR